MRATFMMVLFACHILGARCDCGLQVDVDIANIDIVQLNCIEDATFNTTLMCGCEYANIDSLTNLLIQSDLDTECKSTINQHMNLTRYWLDFYRCPPPPPPPPPSPSPGGGMVFPKWAIYAAAGGGGGLLLIITLICCCCGCCQCGDSRRVKYTHVQNREGPRFSDSMT